MRRGLKSVGAVAQIAAVIASGALTSVLCFGQATGDGCRSLSEQIWYDIVPPRNAHSAGIVNVQSQSGHTSVAAIFSGIGSQRTDDYGEHWTPISEEAAKHVTQLWGKVALSDPNTMYKYESNGVITRSEDGGKKWVKPSPTIDGKPAAQIASAMSGELDYVIEFEITAIHPHKPLTIYATLRVGPPRRPGGDDREQYAMKGMYVSDDGGSSWKEFSDAVGIFDKYPWSVVLGISPSNPDVMFGQGEQGVLRSDDGGKTWSSVGQNDLLNLQPLDTEDRDAGIRVPKRVPLNPTEFVFDPDSAQVVYILSRKGIHRSLDGGDTWTLLNVGFDRLGAIHNMAVDPVETKRLFVGTDRGLFISEDRGCMFARMHTTEP